MTITDPSSTSTRRLLLIRLRSLGDTVLMTPALQAVKRLPNWQVAAAVEEPFDQILHGNPHLDRLFVIRKGSSKLMARFRTIGEIRRSFEPDVTIDLHGGTTSALLTALSGASKRVGYASSRAARLYHVRVPGSEEVWGQAQVHTVENQLSPLKYLGFPVEPLPPLHVVVDPHALQAVRGCAEKKSVRDDFILMHPGAAFLTKQWEAKNFASLARRLTRAGSQVVVTAGPGQEPLLEEVERECPSSVWVVKPLPIQEFVALVSLCSLYIGNDAGGTHVAAALGKKIVVIWGSSDFKVWYPWKVPHRLLRSDLPCIPCPGYYCLYYDEPRCIRSIEVEPVWQAVQALL